MDIRSLCPDALVAVDHVLERNQDLSRLRPRKLSRVAEHLDLDIDKQWVLILVIREKIQRRNALEKNGMSPSKITRTTSSLK